MYLGMDESVIHVLYADFIYNINNAGAGADTEVNRICSVILNASS